MAGLPGRLPASVGTVHAGDWASSVPDLLVAEGRLGVALDEDPPAPGAALEDARRRGRAGRPVAARPPADGDVAGRAVRQRPAAAPPAPAAPTWSRGAHADVTGRRRPRDAARRTAATCGCYAAAGIPTLHYGPGDVRLAHSPRESVSIDETVAVTRALVLTVLRTCGTAG